MKHQPQSRLLSCRGAGLLLAGAGWLLLAAGGARAAAGPAAPAVAEDHVDMERTKIIGNRELPKVLYIVPWKKPLPGELPGRPRGVLDETLEPIDRDVFRHQVQYETQTASPAAKAAPETR